MIHRVQDDIERRQQVSRDQNNNGGLDPVGLQVVGDVVLDGLPIDDKGADAHGQIEEDHDRVADDDGRGELARLLHVRLDGGEHDSSAKAEQNSAEGEEERLESDGARLWQRSCLLSHCLGKDEETGEARENHGAHGDWPEVFGCAEHGNRRHAHRDDDRPVARVQHGQIGLEQVVEVVRGDQQEDDCHSEQLDVGDQHDHVPR